MPCVISHPALHTEHKAEGLPGQGRDHGHACVRGFLDMERGFGKAGEEAHKCYGLTGKIKTGNPPMSDNYVEWEPFVGKMSYQMETDGIRQVF